MLGRHDPQGSSPRCSGGQSAPTQEATCGAVCGLPPHTQGWSPDLAQRRGSADPPWPRAGVLG